MKFFSVLLAVLVLLSSAPIAAVRADQVDPLVGRWKGVDEDSGMTSLIELYVQDDRLFGRILKLTDKDGNELHLVCERCSGELSGRPVTGMTFLRDLKKADSKWVDGTVIDIRPGLTQGWRATCELQIVGSRAELFGYIGALGRIVGRALSGTRYWDRAP